MSTRQHSSRFKPHQISYETIIVDLLISDLLSMLLYRTTVNNVTIIFVSTSFFEWTGGACAPTEIYWAEQKHNKQKTRVSKKEPSLARQFKKRKRKQRK